MQLLLYLQLKPIDAISFQHPFAPELKNKLPDLIIFEADQGSDISQIEIGKNLISDSSKVCLWIECEKEPAFGPLVGLFESLRKNNHRVMTIVKHEHQSLQKILKLLKTEVKQEASADEIIDFFCSS